jgi:hypothetical protein
VANSYLKATKIAAAALGLLEREIILPSLVWRDAGGDFSGAFGDTISLRVPARTTARTRTFRGARPSASEGNGVIVMDELQETKVDVVLDTAPYSAVPITDEELTLDIVNFGEQVLRPQVRAVAESVENSVAAEMVGATYPTDHNLTMNSDPSVEDPFDTIVDARVALNKANVPMSERYLVVGADLEGVFLKSDHLNRVDASGTDSALRNATIGRLAGFEAVVVSNALPANVGFAFHRTAFVLSMRAPVVPDGVTFGSSRAFESLAMRWIRDYDFRNVQDRSLVDTYIGTNHVADGPGTNEVQTITITGTPTGGTFTLTYGGNTTGAIDYDATAGEVQTALRALPNTQDATVAGGPGPGTPYTVTWGNGKDVEQLSANGSFTGGTSPAVAVTTTTAGGGNTFVRAVKITLS